MNLKKNLEEFEKDLEHTVLNNQRINKRVNYHGFHGTDYEKNTGQLFCRHGRSVIGYCGKDELIFILKF